MSGFCPHFVCRGNHRAFCAFMCLCVCLFESQRELQGPGSVHVFLCNFHHSICMAYNGLEIPSVVSASSDFMPISVLTLVQIHLLILFRVSSHLSSFIYTHRVELWRKEIVRKIDLLTIYTLVMLWEFVLIYITLWDFILGGWGADNMDINWNKLINY